MLVEAVSGMDEDKIFIRCLTTLAMYYTMILSDIAINYMTSDTNELEENCSYRSGSVENELMDMNNNDSYDPYSNKKEIDNPNPN